MLFISPDVRLASDVVSISRHALQPTTRMQLPTQLQVDAAVTEIGTFELCVHVASQQWYPSKIASHVLQCVCKLQL